MQFEFKGSNNFIIKNTVRYVNNFIKLFPVGLTIFYMWMSKYRFSFVIGQ